MQRALELARLGIAVSSPNPAVGCMILDRDGQVAGEGWHEYDLLDNADVAALLQILALKHAVESGAYPPLIAIPPPAFATAPRSRPQSATTA